MLSEIDIKRNLSKEYTLVSLSSMPSGREEPNCYVRMDDSTKVRRLVPRPLPGAYSLLGGINDENYDLRK